MFSNIEAVEGGFKEPRGLGWTVRVLVKEAASSLQAGPPPHPQPKGPRESCLGLGIRYPGSWLLPLGLANDLPDKRHRPEDKGKQKPDRGSWREQ